MIEKSCNDIKIFSQNFKAIAQLQAELHLLKVEILDACIRTFCKSGHKYSCIKVNSHGHRQTFSLYSMT